MIFELRCSSAVEQSPVKLLQLSVERQIEKRGEFGETPQGQSRAKSANGGKV